MAACARCGKTNGLKRCSKCKQASYCSSTCQQADWKSHKKTCRFTVTSSARDETPSDALSTLRRQADISFTSSSAIVTKAFGTAEIRMAVLSLLPAKNLLAVQKVCRVWYRTIALEKTLQQRLFLVPGPGELVLPSYDGIDTLLPILNAALTLYKGDTIAMGIQPRDKNQIGHIQMIKRPVFGRGPLHIITDKSGKVEHRSAATLENGKFAIILNPFFTKLWPQDSTNMTSTPYITLPTDNRTSSWRRMQLTSPPMLQLDMSLWYTDAASKGNQMRPSTGNVPTGVTLGHLADLLASRSKELTLHWMSIDGHAWWVRSADAVIVPEPGAGVSVGDNSNASPAGVYINPSNGMPLPRAF